MMPTINQIILPHLIAQIKMGKLRYCEELGFSTEELIKINNLTTDELHFLSNMNTTFFKVSVNHDLLNKMLKRTKDQTEYQNLFDRALVLGASIELMRHFFGAQSHEVSERRRLLGKQISSGRRAFTDPEKSSAAWYRWQEACKLSEKNRELNDITALDNLMVIAEELDLDLTTLWKQVQRWEKNGGEL
ncbi:DUF2857 domain-containing protein [Gallibacterium anatis]|uniref:DUF2857 domain-containing protein n=3 Tax=Gallibacterium TaxID=155493 RepID=A0A1A7PJ92_9PAST|nr:MULTISPECIES: DUF2857 domain-containing protein [Gallibacterium]AEC16416.1 hypothetical protein UMN179_00379 [Gallibacterium anatis UMN179]KGQ32350.1 hypothetical protein P375_06040 [Gallibacterium genomosp. 2]KGQ34516.1 hypothetical protein JP34_07180 [Gallibacterium anatis]KGQ40177.1 hypothetical protein JP35_03625 [Gallibacterium anatis]KGQ42042.1 hypothetical protein JP30_02735 [Gallibacterium anatis IPDH697-78]